MIIFSKIVISKIDIVKSAIETGSTIGYLPFDSPPHALLARID
jgi:hypothetical protein